MRDRRGELDVAHAVAPDLRQRYLDAAFLADDAAIFHPLVLAAQALVILDRAEDAGAEQTVALRLEGAIVDRLRLPDLAVGPRADALGAGDRDTDLVEALRAADLPEYVHQFVHERPLSVTRDPTRLLSGWAGGAGGSFTPPASLLVTRTINSCAARVRR